MKIDALLRRQKVEELTGLSCSSIYRLMALGEFPEPVRVGPRATRWPQSEIVAYLESRPRGVDTEGAAKRVAGLRRSREAA